MALLPRFRVRKCIKPLAAALVLASAYASTPLPLGFWKPASAGPAEPTIPVTSGLIAQWEADSITGLNDDDLVSTWTDQSGNGHDATQSTTANKPRFRTSVFGTKPAVQFARAVGEQKVLSIASIVSLTNFSVFCAYVTGTAWNSGYQKTANMLWWNSGNAGFALNWADGGGGTSSPHLTPYNTGGSELANLKMNSVTWADETKHISSWTWNGTVAAAKADGVTKTTSSVDGGFGTSVPNNIGWHYQFTATKIAAILVYDRVLSDSEISSVETYLNTKYPCY
jgi:hypothetical protein